MTLIDSAVEEILRWWYRLANRDEDIFPEPYSFDITRDPNEHLAFGIGEYFCLGAGFARKEVRVMFEESCSVGCRTSSWTAHPSDSVRISSMGIKRMPATFTAV